MTTLIHENNEENEPQKATRDIIEKLLALESGEILPDRENYRTEVQNYQN